MAEPVLEEGFIDSDLQAEFPGLRLRFCFVDAQAERSPRAVREQLKHISNRVYGERAINLRREPVAHAYRVFFRHVGIDPDEMRTPIEDVVVERLRAGRFASVNLVQDALTISVVETGVALDAFDAVAVEGGLGLRLSAVDERLGSGPKLPPGTIVIADARKPLAVVFAEAATGARPRAGCERVALLAVGVDGVPAIMVEEALWKCATIVTGGA
ncbi:MAG: phenylalanine--tRNA ligase beta subunit-related protein [Dehalococcoidia bacterium]